MRLGIPSHQPTVEARDRERGYTLLGSLGVFGVGTMWYPDDDHIRGLPGYETAPDRDARGQFGGPPATGGPFFN